MVSWSCSLAFSVVEEVLAEQVEVPAELVVLKYSCRPVMMCRCGRRCQVFVVALERLESQVDVEIVAATVQVVVVVVVVVIAVAHRRC